MRKKRVILFAPIYQGKEEGRAGSKMEVIQNGRMLFRCLLCRTPTWRKLQNTRLFFWIPVLFFFSISPRHKICSGVHSRPCYWSKSQAFTNNSCQVLEKKYCQRHYRHRRWLLWSVLRILHILHILQMKMRKLRSDPGQIKRNEGALTQSNNRTANKEPAWLMSLRSLFQKLLEALNITGNLLLYTGVDQL